MRHIIIRKHLHILLPTGRDLKIRKQIVESPPPPLHDISWIFTKFCKTTFANIFFLLLDLSFCLTPLHDGYISTMLWMSSLKAGSFGFIKAILTNLGVYLIFKRNSSEFKRFFLFFVAMSICKIICYRFLRIVSFL